MRCCSIKEIDKQILKKIIMFCDRIKGNLDRNHNDFEVFNTDYMFQDACCMCVIQIGELAGLLSEEVKAFNRNIPWRIVKDTRNFYVHAYGAIDQASVWETLTKDIPALKAACVELLQNSAEEA